MLLYLAVMKPFRTGQTQATLWSGHLNLAKQRNDKTRNLRKKKGSRGQNFLLTHHISDLRPPAALVCQSICPGASSMRIRTGTTTRSSCTTAVVVVLTEVVIQFLTFVRCSSDHGPRRRGGAARRRREGGRQRMARGLPWVQAGEEGAGH